MSSPEFAPFCQSWGIRRDPIVEDLLTELRNWQGYSKDIRAEYDPVNSETRLVFPESIPVCSKSSKTWVRFRDRFRKYSDRISVYFEAKWLQTTTLRSATREHLRLLQAAKRVFNGEIVVTTRRES